MSAGVVEIQYEVFHSCRIEFLQRLIYVKRGLALLIRLLLLATFSWLLNQDSSRYIWIAIRVNTHEFFKGGYNMGTQFHLSSGRVSLAQQFREVFVL